jgi:RNA polymerase sigma factor (sigma-70 family)
MERTRTHEPVPPGAGGGPQAIHLRRWRSKVSVDWGEVYRSTFQELVRFLHRKVWDGERARDLAQEVFVRALRHEPDQPRAWVFKVAMNLARDEARTVLRRKRHLALLKSESEVGVKVATPEDELASQERWAQVRRALDAISDRDREVLLLWDAGLSYGEISDVMELSPGAVGTTLARARRRLVEAHGQMEQEHAAHN